MAAKPVTLKQSKMTSADIRSSDWLGSDPLCMYCANREGCMPYNDQDLAFGAASGKVPTSNDGCSTFKKHYKK